MLNKKEIINKLLAWREGTLEDIIKYEVCSKKNNVILDAIPYDKGYVDAIETVLLEIYDYRIRE